MPYLGYTHSWPATRGPPLVATTREGPLGRAHSGGPIIYSGGPIIYSGGPIYLLGMAHSGYTQNINFVGFILTITLYDTMATILIGDCHD